MRIYIKKINRLKVSDMMQTKHANKLGNIKNSRAIFFLFFFFYFSSWLDTFDNKNSLDKKKEGKIRLQQNELLKWIKNKPRDAADNHFNDSRFIKRKKKTEIYLFLSQPLIFNVNVMICFTRFCLLMVLKHF